MTKKNNKRTLMTQILTDIHGFATKKLEKNSEDSYQSALSVFYFLEHNSPATNGGKQPSLRSSLHPSPLEIENHVFSVRGRGEAK
jgi:hypothetical protein